MRISTGGWIRGTASGAMGSKSGCGGTSKGNKQGCVTEVHEQRYILIILNYNDFN